MKKTSATLVALLVIGLVLWLFLDRRTSANLAGALAGEPKQPPAGKINPSEEASVAKQAKPDEDTALEAAYTAKREKEQREDEARSRAEHNTPIEFYGLVLDQFDRSVADAQVTYASIGGSFEGERKLVTDKQGEFVISGIRGKQLRIIVSHPQYHDFDQTHSYYVYAGNNRGPNFRPKPAKPEIFRLRKKGEAAELIHQSDQILFNHGEPERSFSLLDHTRRRDRPEYVIIRPVDKGRTNSKGKRVLDLELSAPGGGLQLRTDPFQFTAPSDGYQSTVIAPPSVSARLVDFFVRFETGNYGRFTIAGNSGQYDVESYFNPDQSPNLEYDPAKEITVVRNGRPGIDLVYPPKGDSTKQP